MNDTEIAWVAGLLEGEGSFLTQTSGYSPRITCQMTDLDVLNKVHQLCGGTLHPVTKRQEHWKDCWIWRISGDPAAEVMKSILPHMGSRRSEKIQSVLDTWYTNGRPYRQASTLRDQAAREYLDGLGSLREIGRKYGFNYESIRRRAKILAEA